MLAQFATLTLGSGAAAMVLGRADPHPEGHRLVGGVTRAGTEHHELCVGDLESMRTDTKGLLDAGMALSTATWADAAGGVRLVGHGPLRRPPGLPGAHRRDVPDALGIDPPRFPLTFPTRGNMGPAAIPFTLATQSTRCGPATACCSWASGPA